MQNRQQVTGEVIEKRQTDTHKKENEVNHPT